MNLCRACGLDFASVRDFDAHRVGRRAYLFAEPGTPAPGSGQAA